MSTNVELLGSTVDVVGTVMVAYAALSVHHRFRKEQRVDTAVFRAMRHERWVGILGIALIVTGYLLQLPSKL